MQSNKIKIIQIYKHIQNNNLLTVIKPLNQMVETEDKWIKHMIIL